MYIMGKKPFFIGRILLVFFVPVSWQEYYANALPWQYCVETTRGRIRARAYPFGFKGTLFPADIPDMMISLFRLDGSERYHYFSIHDRQASLFEPYALTTSYVINHGKSRDRMYTFKTHWEMDRKIRQLFREKLKKGYRYLYGFERNHSALMDDLAQMDHFARYG